MAKIRVLIVDDHVMFRDCLRAVLTDQEDMLLVGEAGDAEGAIRLAAELRPDVILMDLRLPGRSGVEATREIRASQPAVRVIALTMYHDESTVDAMIQAGAQGYVLKEARVSELLHAIRIVMAGGAALDSNVTARVLAHYRQLAGAPPTPDMDALSGRDVDLLHLLSAGESNRGMAAKLHLSEQTIKNHLSSLYRKLGVNSRTEAVAVALQREIIRRTL